MDKISILEDAIDYMKLLHERVEALEAKAEKQEMEMGFLVRKSRVILEDEDSSDEKNCTFEEQELPEIEARFCENHLLLRVHCQKQNGLLDKLVRKIESMNMLVTNANAISFGNLTLYITIVAEMEKELSLKMGEVVTRIREAIKCGDR